MKRSIFTLVFFAVPTLVFGMTISEVLENIFNQSNNTLNPNEVSNDPNDKKNLKTNFFPQYKPKTSPQNSLGDILKGMTGSPSSNSGGGNSGGGSGSTGGGNSGRGGNQGKVQTANNQSYSNEPAARPRTPESEVIPERGVKPEESVTAPRTPEVPEVKPEAKVETPAVEVVHTTPEARSQPTADQLEALREQDFKLGQAEARKEVWQNAIDYCKVNKECQSLSTLESRKATEQGIIDRLKAERETMPGADQVKYVDPQSFERETQKEFFDRLRLDESERDNLGEASFRTDKAEQLVQSYRNQLENCKGNEVCNSTFLKWHERRLEVAERKLEELKAKRDELINKNSEKFDDKTTPVGSDKAKVIPCAGGIFDDKGKIIEHPSEKGRVHNLVEFKPLQKESPHNFIESPVMPKDSSPNLHRVKDGQPFLAKAGDVQRNYGAKDNKSAKKITCCAVSSKGKDGWECKRAYGSSIFSGVATPPAK
jgi:hypothetical protein